MAASLFLMRHGPAELGPGKSDGERDLTEAGALLVRRVARGLLQLGAAPDAAISSPLPRAAQTARLVAEEIRLSPARLWLAAELQPGAQPESALAAVGEAWLQEPAPTALLLVAHMPDLSILAHHLLGASARGALGFRQAGVARIDFDAAPAAGRGELRWSLGPEELAGG